MSVWSTKDMQYLLNYFKLWKIGNDDSENLLHSSFPFFPAIVRFSEINLPKVTAVIHFSSLPFKWGIPLLMWILSWSLSIRTLCVPSSSFPTCSPSLVIWPRTGAEVSEPPSTSALLLSPPAHSRLSLLVVWVRPWRRWQPFPRQPQRWVGRPPPVFKTLWLFSKPFSASIPISSSITQWGKPPIIIAHRVMVRWRSPVVKLLLVWMTLMHKGPVIWERRGSSLAFSVHIFPEEIQVFFMISSGAVAPVPVQVCKDFVRIKVGFFPWKPPENVNKNKEINKSAFTFKFTTKIKANDEGWILNNYDNAFTCNAVIWIVVLTFQPLR